MVNRTSCREERIDGLFNVIRAKLEESYNRSVTGRLIIDIELNEGGVRDVTSDLKEKLKL